jgi:hypothetical protein
VRDLGNAFGWTFTDYGQGECEFTDGRLTGGFTAGGAVWRDERGSGYANIQTTALALP